MLIHIPRTNPIIFRTAGDYRPTDDLLWREQQNEYLQPFTLTDRLSFQFSWSNHFGDAFSAKIFLCTQNNEYQLAHYNVDNKLNGGVYPKIYYKQQKVGRFYYSGVFCFSEIIEDIVENLAEDYEEVEGGGGIELPELPDPEEINIKKGDVFYIKIQLNDTVYTSNYICIGDGSGTKLIEYNNTSQNFSTYFFEMPNGYNLRVPAFWGHVDYKVDKSLFFDYEGKPELIAAIINNVYTLVIGGLVGMPDDVINNIIAILHCDYKKIDGRRYEIIDSEIAINNVVRYGNRFIVAKLIEKEAVTTLGAAASAFIAYLDTAKMTGKITILANGEWYLDAAENLGYYTFNVTSGENNAEVTFVANKNLTNEIILTTIHIRGKYTDNILATIQLTLPPITEGIGFWVLCDTFRIECDNKKYNIMNKENLKEFFECGDMPTESQFGALIDSAVTVVNAVDDLPPADAASFGTVYLVGANGEPLTIYKCEVNENVYSWENKGLLSAGTINYNELKNKPKINNVVLGGNKTLAELGIVPVNQSQLVENESPTNADWLYVVKNSNKTLNKMKIDTLLTLFRAETLNVEYSVDGINWSSSYMEGCLYLRINEGEAIRIKGEQGPQGMQGDPGVVDIESLDKVSMSSDEDFVLIIQENRLCKIRKNDFI